MPMNPYQLVDELEWTMTGCFFTVRDGGMA